MFDISFTTATPIHDDDGHPYLVGRTTLGSYTETFRSMLGQWSRDDYEQQWTDAARRLLGSEGSAGFFTAAFQLWWIAWREGGDVFVHEQWFVPEVLEGITDFRTAPHHLIGPRETVGENGDRISEWRVTTRDIEAFLARRT